MQRRASVRVRITVAATLVVGVALAAGGFWLVRSQQDALTRNVETAARLRSRDIAATISDGSFPETLAVPRGDENLVQVVDGTGRVVAASANILGEPRISSLQPGENGYSVRNIEQLQAGEGPFRLVARKVTTKSGTFVVYVAGSLEPVHDSTSSLERLLVIGLPGLLLVLAATTWIVTGRALRPVEAIRREVEIIGAEDLHRRVPEPDSGDEIGRLARTMNAMLTRLEDSADRQRRFVADASHELRSPLTGIRAQLEVDLEHPQLANWQATQRDVLADAVRLQRLVDDLLTIATADASNSRDGRVPLDLDEIVLSEARRLRSRSSHHIDTSRVSGAQVVANGDELVRVVRNLLDNAARHARSEVTLTLGESDDLVTLTVSDDGPGVPDDARDRIFERFTRLDDARTRDGGGSGLGLAIAREVITAHGGAITVENMPGARFTVTLPLDPVR